MRYVYEFSSQETLVGEDSPQAQQRFKQTWCLDESHGTDAVATRKAMHSHMMCGQVVKAFDCGPEVPGSNPTCCFTGKVLSLPLLTLGGQMLPYASSHATSKPHLYFEIRKILLI